MWRSIGIDSMGKYLGFYIGPGAGNLSWATPLQTYLERADMWSSLHLGMNLNIMVYRVFIASVLGFVMQLEPVPSNIIFIFEKVLRKLVPEPGNWVTLADVTNLAEGYSFPASFQDPRWTALAAKLRVARYIAPDFHEKERELENVQMNYLRRPCGQWHYSSFFLHWGRRIAQQHGKA